MILRPRLRSRLGCKTCLKRRKKCDEIKPVCGTCRRLNIRCFWTSEEQAKTKVASVKHLAFTLGLKQVSRAPVLHKGLDLSPFRDQICAAYALGTIFNECNAPYDHIETGNNGLTVQSTLSFAPIEDSLAWSCVFAYGLWFVGYKYQNPSLIQAGMLQHGRALRGVLAAIRDEKKRNEMDTLAAINNIAMFSRIRVEAAPHGHPEENFDHTAAFLSIMESMQPWQFQEPRALALFEYTRYAKAVISLVSGRPTSLATEAWNTIPWIGAAHTKSDLQKLIDLLYSLTLLETDLHLIWQSTKLKHNPMRKHTRDHIKNLLVDLHNWRKSTEPELRSQLAATYQDLTPRSHYESRSSSVPSESIEYLWQLGLFNMILIYLCRHVAIDQVLFQEQLSLLGDMVPQDVIHKHENDDVISPQVLPIKNAEERAQIAALEILTVYDCILHRGITAHSIIFLNAPLLVAREFLLYKNDERHLRLNQAVERFSAFWKGKT